MTAEAPVCLITGGSSGIGAACVETFVAAGYRVAFGDLQTAKAEAIAARLGGDVLFRRLDVASEIDFADVAKATLDR